MAKTVHIEVNHSQFETAASALDDYVRDLKKSMSCAQSEVKGLSASWQGADYTYFSTEFKKTDDEGSAHAEMIRTIESYAAYLRYAAKKYKAAQAKAVDSANRLPRW